MISMLGKKTRSEEAPAEESDVRTIVQRADDDTTPDTDGNELPASNAWSRKLPWKRGKTQDSGSDQPDGLSLTNAPFVTRAIQIAIVLALICGPLALLKGCGSSSGPSSAANQSGYDARLMGRRDAAVSRAEDLLVAWLAASKQDSSQLNEFFPTDDMTLPDAGASATDLQMYRATATAPGVWEVQLSAVVVPDGAATGRRRYFEIPVGVTGNDAVAAAPLALPAEVSAPRRSSGNVTLSYGQQVPPGSGAFTTVRGFLNAMLAGQGDITLFTRPGVHIPAVKPAPWSTVTVSEVDTNSGGQEAVTSTAAEGTTVKVLVTAQLTPPTTGQKPTPSPSGSGSAPQKSSQPSSMFSTDPDAPAWPGAPAGGDSKDSSHSSTSSDSKKPTPSSTSAPESSSDASADSDGAVTSQYLLDLTVRSGRWEVSGISTAPVLSNSIRSN